MSRPGRYEERLVDELDRRRANPQARRRAALLATVAVIANGECKTLREAEELARWTLEKLR